MFNPILAIDGYKLDHRRQYPDNTESVYSNWTPRDSRVTDQNEVVFVGLQYFLKKFLQEDMQRGFFDVPKADVVAAYARRVNSYLGPNSVGTQHIEELHDLGYVPLIFKALPEGTRVPLRVPMFTVESTDYRFAWLVNYFETLLSATIWMPCTSATSAMRLRRLLDQYAEQTGSPEGFVDFQGHDFSFRGMAGIEAASLSGLGHLLSFVGTDTIPAIELIEQYYPTTDMDYLIGASVAATEHSVMCAGGELGERETFERLLDLYPTGIFSVVSDTWDLWNVLTVTLPSLKDRIMSRDGKLVVRPDSGDPVDILCGDRNAPEGSPASKGVVELLWDEFGGEITSTGYKLLDSHIGCIYGDSITYDRAYQILSRLAAKGFASGNVVFGVGSFTYQFTTRDTYGFAMKATWAQINGEGVDMFKDPVTDNGVKKSAKGRLAVMAHPSGYHLINQATPEQEAASALQTVWIDGNFVKVYSIEDLRKNVRA